MSDGDPDGDFEDDDLLAEDREEEEREGELARLEAMVTGIRKECESKVETKANGSDETDWPHGSDANARWHVE